MKALYILGLIALVGLGIHIANYSSAPKYTEWEQWQIKYGKSFENEIESYRREVYYENLRYIKNTNARQKEYTLGENQFMDLTKEEFVATYLNEQPVPASNNELILEQPLGDVDWRTQGAVSPIKDQGQCGSCWSFGCTGGLESANFIFGSKTMTLFSEQQLVDCSQAYGNQGCNGGLAMQAYQYVIDHGIVTESEYPYVAKDQTCKINQGPFKIKSYTPVTRLDCNALQVAITQQPTSVSVDATNWSFYKSGIFSNCKLNINHAVLAVGFTSTYWIVKNSWGTSWGEQGFIQLAKGNTCGICDHPSYPSL